MNEDLVRQIAASVWRKVAAEATASEPSPPPELPRSFSIQSSAIQNREGDSETGDLSSPAAFFAPWTSEVFQPAESAMTYPPQPRTPAAQPSQEQFNVTEAAEVKAAVNELVEFFESQSCTIEKGKGCDHCGACCSLGF
jgi:hypothetical protein